MGGWGIFSVSKQNQLLSMTSVRACVRASTIGANRKMSHLCQKKVFRWDLLSKVNLSVPLCTGSPCKNPSSTISITSLQKEQPLKAPCPVLSCPGLCSLRVAAASNELFINESTSSLARVASSNLQRKTSLFSLFVSRRFPGSF